MSKAPSVGLCQRSGKVPHPTRGDAYRQLQRLREHHEYVGTVYKCAACSGWHVGRKIPPAAGKKFHKY